MFFQNAELARHWRAEASWQRLGFVPAVALLIVYLLKLLQSDAYTYAFWFLAFAAVWGSFNALWSIKEELDNRTRYWQIALPFSPLQLLAGKLAGCLALPWLGGALLLLFAPPAAGVWPHVVLVAAYANALALFLGLITTRGARAQVSLAALVCAATTVPLIALDLDHQNAVQWYGAPYDKTAFANASLLAHIAWLLLACWRLFALVKQQAPRPRLFLPYLLFEMAYVGGFAFELEPSAPAAGVTLEHALASYGLAAWLACLAVAYVSLFLSGGAGLAALADAIARRAKWLPLAPPWLQALAVLLALLPILALAQPAPVLMWFMLAMAGLALRDAALVLALVRGRRGGNLPEGAAFATLMVLHALLPYLLDVAGAGAYWLRPLGADAAQMQTAAASAAAQAALLCGGLLLSLKRASRRAA